MTKAPSLLSKNRATYSSLKWIADSNVRLSIRTLISIIASWITSVILGESAAAKDRTEFAQ
jgi:hypothetical protein